MTNRRDFLKTAGMLGSFLPLVQPPKSFATDLDVNDDAFYAAIRKQLLVPSDRIYLNTGSLGPSPTLVIDKVQEKMRQLEGNPVGENWGPLGEEMEAVRDTLAAFIHCGKDEVVLTRNTTEGLNLIAQSLPLQKGDEILTTTLEHGGGEVGLEFLAQTKGAVIRKVELPLPPESPEQIIDAIARAITPSTRYLMLSHINTATGIVMPLESIARIAREKGIWVVADGAQAPGQIPIDVEALGVDAYASSGHKWLMGPKETGFLFLRREFQQFIKPVFLRSGAAAYTASSGTRNVATAIGLGAAVEWHASLGVDRTRARCRELANYCHQQLQSVRGLRVISSSHEQLASAMVSFSLEKESNTHVFNALRAKNIIVKHLPQHNGIRISCHLFVSRADIDTLTTHLRALL